MIYLYGFEAKSIQTYISESGRLRDLAGGSQLVDALASAPVMDGGISADLVQGVLSMIDVDGFGTVRRAGGAFTLTHTDRTALATFRAAYTLAVQKFAPGLPFIDAIVEGDTLGGALDAMPHALAAARAQPRINLPEAGPIVALAPRTGRPATTWTRFDEMLDEATDAKRTTIALQKYSRGQGELSGLERRMMPEARRASHVWPTELNAIDAPSNSFIFPGLDENATIGLIHADGNRFGQTLISLVQALKLWPDAAKATAFLMGFSRGIAQATESAVHAAVEDVLVGPSELWDSRTDVQYDRRVLAARPIVLGGDDLTIMVRGDLAFEFSIAFLDAFERETARALHAARELLAFSAPPPQAKIAIEAALPARLTAGAGIALVSASQPFDRALELAEEIAKASKQAAKNDALGNGRAIPVSSVAFHRATAALLSDYSTIREKELLLFEGSIRKYLTMGAYRIGDVDDRERSGLPHARALLDLTALIARPAFPSGPLREYLGSLRVRPYEAQRNYLRWREIMTKRNSSLLAQFDASTQLLGVSNPEDQPFGSLQAGDPLRTPLLDALSLVMAGKRAGGMRS